MLDQFYIAILNHHKKKWGRRSFSLAFFYINFLELSLLLALASFFLAFAAQMKMLVMSTSKFWVLFALVGLFVVFKNWMRYNGKKRNILNAKLKRQKHSVYTLWILPFACLFIAVILQQIP